MSKLRLPVTPHDHTLGPFDAPVTLVEYGDYECPHCGAAYPILQLIREHFDNRLLFAFRHFPLSQVHPNAQPAAESAEFAGAHNQFWAMHDGLFENQDHLGLPLIVALASALGLSEVELREALIAGTYLPKVRSDFVGGVRSGVNGTPAFFINGERHDGTYAYDDLVEAISLHMRVKSAL
jgi:protein-disulfide isomerase